MAQQDVVRELTQYCLSRLMGPSRYAKIRDADTMLPYPSRVKSVHARGYPTKQTRSTQHAMISRTLVLMTMVGEAQQNSYIQNTVVPFRRLVTSCLSRASC